MEPALPPVREGLALGLPSAEPHSQHRLFPLGPIKGKLYPK